MGEFSLGQLLRDPGIDELELHGHTINPQFLRMLRTLGFDRRWARGEGAYLFDAEGRRFLDMLGGFGMFNVGRNNPTVRRALVEALDAETAGSIQLGISRLPALLAEQLLAIAPPSLQRVLFTSSGTESVEAALKLARAATGRSGVVFAEHAFHGLTLGSLSANGNLQFTARFGPLLPGFSPVPFNDLEALETRLRREDVALFLIEPVQGKGAAFPAPGYLEGAQELCRRYGTLFCVDEVQTGFGRTGKMFALEHWGLEPDLMTVAKSLSGGYVPVGACLTSAHVFDSVFDSLKNALAHGSTFAPNDLAMAAGLASLHVLREERLVERSAALGELLLERTRPLADRYEVVSDVRGLGLFWAIEFGEPAERRISWRALERIQPGLFAQLVVGPLFHDHAILSQVAGHDVNIIKALPPLTLAESDVDWFAGALDAVVAEAQRMPRAMVRFAVQAARGGRPRLPRRAGASG
jgi:ornithine--oxo-acid transaminase